MNDLDLKNILDAYKFDYVGFEYQKYGSKVFYISYIKPIYFKVPPFLAHGSNSDDAFNNAKKLLDKYKMLNFSTDIELPSLDKQPYIGGYYNMMLDKTTEIRFVNFKGSFFVVNIQTKDNDGFYWLDVPEPIGSDCKFEEYFPNGNELWSWNNIGPLCGSGGSLIVKNGMVLAQKTEIIS